MDLTELFLLENGNDVANFLLQKGVKGFPGDIHHCPIANYIRSEHPYLVTITIADKIIVTFPDGQQESYAMTLPLVSFINMFDDGKYSDLVERMT